MPEDERDPDGVYTHEAEENTAAEEAAAVGGTLLERWFGRLFPGRRGKPCCFVAGTQVLTENGLKNIEDIQVGDLVWSRDPETGEQELKPVTDVIPRHIRQIWEVSVSNGMGVEETFQTTNEHPWWVQELGWRKTDELQPGMSVEDAEQRPLRINRVENMESSDGTYNLTVADFHTYFVGITNVLVHNCKNKDGHRPKTRGANRNDRKQVRDVANQAGIQDTTGFRNYVHEVKKEEGRGATDNFTFEELMQLAQEFKDMGGS